MGKRIRSLSVGFGNADMHITAHAIRRFQQRVNRMPTWQVPTEIARMVAESTPVIRQSKSDGRIYLAHDECVFVLTREGLIITVLHKHDSRRQFAESVKAMRKKPRKDHGRVARMKQSRVKEIDNDEDYSFPKPFTNRGNRSRG